MDLNDYYRATTGCNLPSGGGGGGGGEDFGGAAVGMYIVSIFAGGLLGGVVGGVSDIIMQPLIINSMEMSRIGYYGVIGAMALPPVVIAGAALGVLTEKIVNMYDKYTSKHRMLKEHIKNTYTYIDKGISNIKSEDDSDSASASTNSITSNVLKIRESSSAKAAQKKKLTNG